MCSCGPMASSPMRLRNANERGVSDGANPLPGVVMRVVRNLRPMLGWELIGAAAGYYIAPRLGYANSTGLVVGFLAPPVYSALKR